MNLPINCRKQARTLKIDVLSDIRVDLIAWSEPGCKGIILDEKKEILTN